MDQEIEKISKKLMKELDEDRYRHTQGVMYTSAALAMRYGADLKKALLAGLLHDCAKDMDKSEMPALCDRLGVELDPVKREQRSLIHADLGAKLAQTEFGVTDPDIISAIRYHTLGRPEMTTLEKILYIADFIEPNRKSFIGLDELRELSELDLDFAMLKALDSSISYVRSQGKVLHEQSLLTQAYYSKIAAAKKKEKVMA